jgi:hypothetical protein
VQQLERIDLRKLRVRDRKRILEELPGLIRGIARDLKVDPGTVSRTFTRQTKRPNPKIVRALEEKIGGLSNVG